MVKGAELVEMILTDLQLTLPEDLEWSVRQDDEIVYVWFRRTGFPYLSSESGTPLSFSRCHLVEKVISDLQDFMADAYSVWWPMLGRHRLKYEIDCQDDRPRLRFRL